MSFMKKKKSWKETCSKFAHDYWRNIIFNDEEDRQVVELLFLRFEKRRKIHFRWYCNGTEWKLKWNYINNREYIELTEWFDAVYIEIKILLINK